MLKEIQKRVAQLAFSLPESEDFVIAGGAALVFQSLVDRLTKDIDLFGATMDSVDRLPEGEFPVDSGIVAKIRKWAQEYANQVDEFAS